MKRKLALFAWWILLAVLLLSCQGAGGNQAVSETITVMGRKNDLAKPYITSIFAQYEAATGHRIQPIPYEDAVFETTAEAQFAKGEVPDIFLHFNNADLARFDVEANFLDLRDQPWVGELTENARAYCTDTRGCLMGLPFWESSVSGCYYNKTILDSLSLKSAVTQAEFDVLCLALMEAGYTPICWPANGSAWMVQFALDPVFADEPQLLEQLNRNEIRYADIPAVRDMVCWIDEAAKAGWLGPDYLQWSIDSIPEKISSGDSVMTFIWDTWFYTDLPADGTYTVEDFALMPSFLNTVPNGTYEGGNLNMMMVNRNGDHVDTCLDFLAFCTQAEHYNIAFDGISTVNCFNSQTTNIQSPMLTDVALSIEANLRPSTAASKIIGYSDSDVAAALDQLFRGLTDVDGCIALMDEARMAAAAGQGAEGF